MKYYPFQILSSILLFLLIGCSDTDRKEKEDLIEFMKQTVKTEKNKKAVVIHSSKNEKNGKVVNTLHKNGFVGLEVINASGNLEHQNGIGHSAFTKHGNFYWVNEDRIGIVIYEEFRYWDFTKDKGWVEFDEGNREGGLTEFVKEGFNFRVKTKVYKNGNSSLKTHYCNGLKCGPEIEYYKNGDVKETNYYFSGNLVAQKEFAKYQWPHDYINLLKKNK